MVSMIKKEQEKKKCGWGEEIGTSVYLEFELVQKSLSHV